MEENVALDSKKQKKFVKSLTGIKKLMEKTGAVPDKPVKKTVIVQKKKPIKGGKVIKKKRKVRGLVYLSHIPHGFYEHQMTEYFKQFGLVTNARVIRSKRTGRSKGHAFVEFKDTAVAQVVAETMNNYLMGKRLIKAVYIPPKDQRFKARRKNLNEQNNPANKMRLRMKKAYNSIKDESEELKIARKLMSNLSKTKTKLKELGVDYDFFTPVDVPKALTDNVELKEEKLEDTKEGIVPKPEKKKRKKNKKNTEETNIAVKEESVSNTKQNNVQEPKMKQKKNKSIKTSEVLDKTKDIAKVKEEETKNIIKNIKDKIVSSNNEINMNQQGEKQQKMRDAGVKLPEDFITLANEDDDSDDSSYKFDSDENEKLLNDDETDSDVSMEDDNDEVSNDVSLKDKVKDVISNSKNLQVKQNKKNKNKGKKVKQSVESNKPTVKLEVKQESKKRKESDKVEVQSKKPKFEKQNNKKLTKKQMKRK